MQSCAQSLDWTGTARRYLTLVASDERAAGPIGVSQEFIGPATRDPRLACMRHCSRGLAGDVTELEPQSTAPTHLWSRRRGSKPPRRESPCIPDGPPPGVPRRRPLQTYAYYTTRTRTARPRATPPNGSTATPPGGASPKGGTQGRVRLAGCNGDRPTIRRPQASGKGYPTLPLERPKH